jgi:hypothetical protein
MRFLSSCSKRKPLIYNLSVRDNGVSHLSERDCWQIVRYFDSDKDGGLNFKELMEVMLPCDNLFLRSSVTQRPSFNCPPDMRLHSTVEKELQNLL